MFNFAEYTMRTILVHSIYHDASVNVFIIFPKATLYPARSRTANIYRRTFVSGKVFIKMPRLCFHRTLIDATDRRTHYRWSIRSVSTSKLIPYLGVKIEKIRVLIHSL